VQELKHRLFSLSTLWYWGVIGVCVLAIVSVVTIPPAFFPLILIRWASGLLILFFIPGLCFIKALFPEKEIKNIETLTLSVSFSLILVVLVGLFCNFTPVGLKELPIVAILSAVSVTLATAAVYQQVKIVESTLTFFRSN